MMAPGILILTVGQMKGALWPEGPSEWLHVPNLRRLAKPSVPFVNSHIGSGFCAPGRAAFMSGALPLRTGVCDSAADFAPDLPNHTHFLRRVGCQPGLSAATCFVGPNQPTDFAERLTADVYPAVSGWTPGSRHSGARIDWWYHSLGDGRGRGRDCPPMEACALHDRLRAALRSGGGSARDDEPRRRSRRRRRHAGGPPDDGCTGVPSGWTARFARARPAAGSSTRRCARGHYHPQRSQPLQKASKRYMRNHMDLNVLEESQRFPRGE